MRVFQYFLKPPRFIIIRFSRVLIDSKSFSTWVWYEVKFFQYNTFKLFHVLWVSFTDVSFQNWPQFFNYIQIGWVWRPIFQNFNTIFGKTCFCFHRFVSWSVVLLKNLVQIHIREQNWGQNIHINSRVDPIFNFDQTSFFRQTSWWNPRTSAFFRRIWHVVPYLEEIFSQVLGHETGQESF